MFPFLHGKHARATDLPLLQRLPVLRFPLPGEMFLNNRLEIDDFAHIVPHHRRRREAGALQRGRRRGESREDHTGQYNHTALHADSGIAFQKGDADAAGGLSCETGQRDGHDSGGHIEPKKTGIYRQNHD